MIPEQLSSADVGEPERTRWHAACNFGSCRARLPVLLSFFDFLDDRCRPATGRSLVPRQGDGALMRRHRWRWAFVVVLLLGCGSTGLLAQGVTTAAVSGVVLDNTRAPISGVSLAAVHVPSGTQYNATSRQDGRFSIPGMRVGGPYRITASIIGYSAQAHEDITLTLGVATDIEFVLQPAAIQLDGISVTAQTGGIISSARTGAATAIPREAINVVPTISGRINDVIRLTPQASGMSFAGQDNRLNNITVDGSTFNNSFGLGGQPGDRTGVAPISLSALEQVQVNVAPYDVRYGNFVGAAVNSVTRSGDNEFRGSLFLQFRDESMVGRNAGSNRVDPGTFDFRNLGGWASGPIVRNRLFFFVNFEDDALTEPGTTFRANTGGQTAEGNITRVLASQLDSLSSFLRDNFDYETGPYQGYDHQTPARRLLAKLDYNLNARNKLSVRYTHLDSNTDVLLSNSGSLGGPANPANRRTNLNALNFQNSNYQILENIRSIVGEWNSLIGNRMANNLIAGYTFQDESRASRGRFFPFVDINRDGVLYTSFGFEPFTPNNELRYKTAQIQNNFTIFGNRHEFTFGAAAEIYRSENVFFSGAQSVYVYNSLEDFYTDARDHLANPNRSTSPITLRRFQVSWANLPDMEKPVQPLEVFFAGAYAQDHWTISDRLNVTLGLRVEAPFFGNTAYANPNADALTFRDEDGNAVQYSTGKLPDANPLFSPRIGFNMDPFGDSRTQVRGGTGIFTGRPAYVWISNQIGNTGMLTGSDLQDNTTVRPFHPDPNRYKPEPTGNPARSYALAVTDPDFKFPQVWRTNVGVDQTLPRGFIATAEFIYNRDVNGIYYINANLPAAQGALTGADTRPRWVGPSCGSGTTGPCVNRINNAAGNQVTNAIVLKNQNVGRSWNAAVSLEKPFARGLYTKVAYAYGEAKNLVDPGSIASGSWTGNAIVSDPNNPVLGFSANSPGHRLFGLASYRLDWARWGGTTFTLYGESRTIGNASYTYANDLNGDGAANDLLYVPKDKSEMNFVMFTSGGRTYTAAEQADAWEAFIAQDEYLSSRRGMYAERNAVFMPMVTRFDLSIAQELARNAFGTRNALQLRADVLNVANLLNKDWGLSQRMVTTQPLTNTSVNAEGVPSYRLRVINNELLKPQSFERTAFVSDVYRVQLSLRYTFN
jgi:hypothetical protein